jgi:glycosyltransferase involved in cell wall biosynthesis
MIVINENDRRYVIRHLWKRSKKVVVIPHGVSEEFLKSVPPDEAPRGKGLLYCGTWTGMKGVDYLRNAYNRLVSDGTKVPFTILGGGVSDVEIREGFTSEANKLITIIPRLDEAQLMEEYRQHDILVFPSTYEGFGMVLLEAMSQGLAVVATPQGAALSLIQDEVTGILVPIRNPVAITAAVRRLWEDVAQRRRLGRAAREAVAGCTWEATALKTLALYAEAVEAARS